MRIVCVEIDVIGAAHHEFEKKDVIARLEKAMESEVANSGTSSSRN